MANTSCCEIGHMVPQGLLRSTMFECLWVSQRFSPKHQWWVSCDFCGTIKECTYILSLILLLFFHVKLSSSSKPFLPLVVALLNSKMCITNSEKKVICCGKIPWGFGPSIIYGCVILHPSLCSVFKGYFRTGTLNTWSQCVGWAAGRQVWSLSSKQMGNSSETHWVSG